MKTRNLLIALGVAALSATNVLASDALLSPKASEQPKTVSSVNNDPNLVATGLQSASPRVLDNQIKTVSGKSMEVTPSLLCIRHMSGTPKMIAACPDSASGSMSCCSVAGTK